MASGKSKIIPTYMIGGSDRPWGGLNTATKDNRDMDPGESWDQNNWLTGRDQDNIQLRRGTALLGSTRRNIANQHVSGIGVGTRIDGTQIPFYTFAQKIMYYNPSTQDTQEVDTTDILPVAANDEDMCIESYSNTAGSFVYLSSLDSSIYKIPVANPGSVVDQKTANFHFNYFKFDQSRMVACNRKGATPNSLDASGLYISHIDTNTPAGVFMSVPAAPTGAVVAGGSIPNGTYYYVVTAVSDTGVETTQSAQSAGVVISAGPSGVNLTWNSVAGAVSYNIYRTTTSGTYTSPSFIGNTTLTAFNDGESTPATGAPPATTTITIISNIGTGDGSTKTFSGTLTPADPPSTTYAVTITDGNETFTDNRNGVLIGSLGGTGTINYATNAYSVTFNTAPTNGAVITANFLQENATVDGVADFNIDGTDFSKAQVFRQDDSGGNAQAIFSWLGVDYCLHVMRSWQFQFLQGATDVTNAFSNQPYYEQIGIPYSRGAFQTGDGVIFINNANPANPTFSILEIPPNSTNLTVVPVPVSQKIDFSSFGFATCVVRRWGDYDIVGMQVANQYGAFNGYNSLCFVRNIWSGLWNKLDYEFSCLEEFVGTLISGDSLSPNVFTLFSGFDDDGEVIDNYYNNAFVDLDIEGLKTVGYLHVEGLIQPSQSVQVGIALDSGSYVTQPTTILGNGPYVNQGVSVGIGTYTMGANIIGGEGSASQFANKFELDIPIHTDKFEYISFQFEALGVGYVQINKVGFKDIRLKRRRLLVYEDQEIDS